MTTVDDYIATLDPENAALLGEMARTVKLLVPNVEQGVSYSMPCFKYKGKALVSFMVCKNHLGLYPFSGKVIEGLKPKLSAFTTSAGSGSIHFSVANPIASPLLTDIIQARMAEIDKPRPRKS